MSPPRLIARFRTERGLAKAARGLEEDGIGPVRIYSPHPVTVAGQAGVRHRISVPLITLAAGLAFFFASLALQIYADAANYVLDIGGRPPDSWPAFIPTAFENGVLGALLAGFVAFLLLVREPGDLDEQVEATMLDSYYLVLSPGDEMTAERAYEHFREAHAEQTIEVPP